MRALPPLTKPWLLWPARAFVAAVALTIALLALLQHGGAEGDWIELSRYLPWYWLLLPVLAALALAFALGRAWVFGAGLALIVLVFIVMGFEWGGGDAVDEKGGFKRLRLMTWNIKAENARLRPDGVAALEREVRSHDPDIVVMQDAHGLLVDRAAPAKTDGAVFGLPHVHALGQYVLASKHPIRGCNVGWINYRVERHRYLQCEVTVGDRALSVVTAHFASPRLGLAAARREGTQGSSEWHGSHADRVAQAAQVARDLSALKRPLVVMGDLNASEHSPVVQTILNAGPLRDTHAVAGKGWGFTYGQSLRRGLSFLRIDHILVSADIAVLSSFAGGGDASDHRPVIADVMLRAAAPAPAPSP